MLNLNRNEYTTEVQERYDVAYERLYERLKSIRMKKIRNIKRNNAPDADAEEFRRALNEELAAGFPIDWLGAYFGWQTLIYWAAAWSEMDSSILQITKILIATGADVNAHPSTEIGTTPLGIVCREYVDLGAPESFSLICLLLAAGARPELDEGWKKLELYIGVQAPGIQARRDRLEAYIASWTERRAAAGRAGTPAFDYAV